MPNPCGKYQYEGDNFPQPQREIAFNVTRKQFQHLLKHCGWLCTAEEVKDSEGKPLVEHYQGVISFDDLKLNETTGLLEQCFGQHMT